MEAVPPVPLTARLRVLAALAALGWFFWVVYATGFEEGFAFLAGLLCVALLLTIFARFAPVLRGVLAAFLIAANVLAGLSFLHGAALLRDERTAFVRAVLDHAADALSRFHAHAGLYPECPWKCMAEELEEFRFWVGDIRYESHGKPGAKYLPHVPPRDPWGCRYAYVILPGKTGFVLSSSGPDRRFGTLDDLRREVRASRYAARAEPPAAAK